MGRTEQQAKAVGHDSDADHSHDQQYYTATGCKLKYMAGCQNYGPFLGVLSKIRHLLYRGPEFRQL